MKTLIKALLAASMLMPVAAQAQDDRRERRMESRGDRGARFQPRAPAEAQAQVQQPVQPRPAPPFRGERDGNPGVQAQAGAMWQQRQRDVGSDMREQRRSAIRQNLGQQFGNADRRENWRSDRPDAGFQGRPDRRDDGRDGRRDGQRDYRNDRRDDRQDIARDRQDIARDRQRQQWDRDRAYAGRNGSSFRSGSYGRNDDQRQGWNRGWRNDDRYDWNRYRSGNSSLYRLPRYYAPYGWGNGYRRFSVGITLSSVLWDQDYWIDDPWSYRLPEAYGPYRWVRYYDDALLVDIRSGQVVDTVYGIFY